MEIVVDRVSRANMKSANGIDSWSSGSLSLCQPFQGQLAFGSRSRILTDGSQIEESAARIQEGERTQTGVLPVWLKHRCRPDLVMSLEKRPSWRNV